MDESRYGSKNRVSIRYFTRSWVKSEIHQPVEGREREVSVQYVDRFCEKNIQLTETTQRYWMSCFRFIELDCKFRKVLKRTEGIARTE